MLTVFSHLNKRLSVNILIGLTTFAIEILLLNVLVIFYPESQRLMFRYSLSTGYISLLLLTITLSLGSWNILKGRANPASINLRRDIGIWCGIFSLFHIAFGINVHLKNWTQYFIDANGNLLLSLFGFTNYLGVISTLIVIILLLTSNNFSLRNLKYKKWKLIQRFNYFLAVFVFAHSLLYQIVEKRLLPFCLIIGIIALWTIIIQFMGFQKIRRSR